jgi:putative PIN family toxin of toxin-antitoxin system
MLPIVIFDTNILISATLSQKSNPYACLQLAKDGLVKSVTCREILDEFKEKLSFKFDYSPNDAQSTTDRVLDYSQLVNITNSLKGICADPDDDMVLECAVVANANYIVTGDKHLLSLINYQNSLILKATDFLASIQELQN